MRNMNRQRPEFIIINPAERSMYAVLLQNCGRKSKVYCTRQSWRKIRGLSSSRVPSVDQMKIIEKTCSRISRSEKKEEKKFWMLRFLSSPQKSCVTPVSYTHLDVYKRQESCLWMMGHGLQLAGENTETVIITRIQIYINPQIVKSR